MNTVTVKEIIENPARYTKQMIKLRGHFENGFLVEGYKKIKIDGSLLYMFENPELRNYKDKMILECVVEFDDMGIETINNLFVADNELTNLLP